MPWPLVSKQKGGEGAGKGQGSPSLTLFPCRSAARPGASRQILSIRAGPPPRLVAAARAAIEERWSDPAAATSCYFLSWGVAEQSAGAHPSRAQLGQPYSCTSPALAAAAQPARPSCTRPSWPGSAVPQLMCSSFAVTGYTGQASLPPRGSAGQAILVRGVVKELASAELPQPRLGLPPPGLVTRGHSVAPPPAHGK